MNINKLTKAQQNVLQSKYKEDREAGTYVQFLKTAYQPIGCDGAVAVDWNGMQLLIERDGYCHS